MNPYDSAEMRSYYMTQEWDSIRVLNAWFSIYTKWSEWETMHGYED